MSKLKNSTVLITGGTGSFGNAFLDKYLNSEIKEFRLFSRDEKKQHDLRLKYKNDKIKLFLGDVRDPNAVDNAMVGVNYVFHAAALKQVPSCEFFPIEATKTNVIGTQNVISSAIKNKVSKVVCLSTDKAAYPINAMGISKALMEKVAIAASRDSGNTTICVTRYGNVMASRGSVIPLFVDRIKNNEDLTITDGRMTRFIMSLEEAVELVMYAFENGNSGDLFVQKSPACTIEDLAQALKNIFKSKVDNKILGIRHGEKMYETLCTSEEMAKAIDLPGFYKIPPDERDLNYDKYFEKGIQKPSITEYNSNNTTQLSIREIEKKLLTLSFIREEL